MEEYRMKKCPKCGLEASDDQIFCQQCGSRLDNEISKNAEVDQVQNNNNIPTQQVKKDEASANIHQKPRKRRGILLGISICISIASIITAIIKYNDAEDYKRRYQSIRYDYSELEKDIIPLEEQVNFMDQYIVIIDANKDDNLYHTYTCDVWNNWSGDWSMLAYNVTTAENRGYEPCPECH